MDQDDFRRDYDGLLQKWERGITGQEIDRILSQKLQPLLKRIEYLEDALNQPLPGPERTEQAPPPPSLRRPPIDPDFAPRLSLRSCKRVVPANPYEIRAGRELDLLIHQYVMKLPSSSDQVPHYSTNSVEAKRVLAQLRTAFSTVVISGRTSLSGRSWFARFATSSNHGTEVLAETLPLAICRLALLVVEQAERRVGAPSPN